MERHEKQAGTSFKVPVSVVGGLDLHEPTMIAETMRATIRKSIAG
jgi:hypothetical protein